MHLRACLLFELGGTQGLFRDLGKAPVQLLKLLGTLSRPGALYNGFCQRLLYKHHCAALPKFAYTTRLMRLKGCHLCH